MTSGAAETPARQSLSRPGVTAGELAGGLARQLRRAGIVVVPDRIGRLAKGLLIIPPGCREQLYWVARLTLVADRAQLPVFDAVFSALFDGLLDPADSRGDTSSPAAEAAAQRTRSAPRTDNPASSPTGPPATSAAPEVPGAGESDPDAPEREAVLAMASAEQRLRNTSFAELSAGDETLIRALVRRIVLATPMRLTRRSQPTGHAAQRIDVRRTVKAARRGGGEVIDLLHSRRRARPRRLVLLCDVSASMEPYARVFLSLLHGAVIKAHAEAFVFSTGLTRLTRQLATREPGQALARAAAASTDWAGGTRLAGSIGEFVDRFGRRGLARGAVIVILSDGWSLDDPALVAHEMERLRRLAFRIVWINPRKAADGFVPLVGGMAAALPFCDEFVSGHSLAALDEVTAAIGRSS